MTLKPLFVTQKRGSTVLAVWGYKIFKQQKGAIPLGNHQIPAMEKFEDRPMSPVFELYPIPSCRLEMFSLTRASSC